MEAEGQSGAVNGAPVFATGPEYFETIGAPLFAGRDFSDADVPTSPAVAIVNRSFAETFFPGRDVIGQRIRLATKRELGPGDWRTIVGVVTNVMQNDAFRQSFRPAVYMPYAQETANYGWFFVRARYMSDGLAAAVRREAELLDPSLELTSFMTLEANLGFGLDKQGGGGPGQLRVLGLVAARRRRACVCSHRVVAGGGGALCRRRALRRSTDEGNRRAHGAWRGRACDSTARAARRE